MAALGAMAMALACDEGVDLGAANDGGYAATDGDTPHGGSTDEEAPPGRDDPGPRPGRDPSGDPGGGQGGATEEAAAPAPARLRRLLARQYINSVGTLLGPVALVRADPPDDPEFGTLPAVSSGVAALSDSDVATYEASATAIADAAIADTAHMATLRPCEPTSDACHETFVSTFGRLAFRRPLTEAETQRWTQHAIAREAEEGDFDAGTRSVIAGMLQSPYFLYQVEYGEPVPGEAGLRALSDYELATRLSFFLVDGTPDAVLLDDVEAGALEDDAGIRSVARALLARDDARAALAAFNGDVFGLDRVATTPKDLETFPLYSAALAEAMAEETQLLLDDIVWTRRADYLEIFDAPYTFVDRALASLYELPQAETLGVTHARVDLPVGERAGILGHAGLMSLYAHTDQTSPTLRGRFVREVLLCGTVPDPPAGADTSPPQNDGLTKREQLEQHVSDPACSGCHNLMDPIGFALEPLDGIGVFREQEAGTPIDAAVEMQDLGAFDGVAELGTVLRDSTQAKRCIVQTMLRRATGAMEGPDTTPLIEDLVIAFDSTGHDLQELMVDIAAHDTFRYVGEPR